MIAYVNDTLGARSVLPVDMHPTATQHSHTHTHGSVKSGAENSPRHGKQLPVFATKIMLPH